MARLLLVALCIACASAFSPPATLAPRTVIARTASVEMGARGKSQAQRGNINLLKKPKAAPKKAAGKAAPAQPLGAVIRGFLGGNFLGDGKGGAGDAKGRKTGSKYRTDGSLIFPEPWKKVGNTKNFGR